jgi:hypothetical protein
MYKVNFVLVPSFSSSEWLNEKMLQITQAFVTAMNNKNYPIHTVNSYEEINHIEHNAEYLVVIGAGNIIVDVDHFYGMLENIPEDVGLIANLLQYEHDITPYFHEQCFIIKTSVLDQYDFSEGSDYGTELIRSIEDMHDGHAPLFLTLGNQQVERKLQFGTKIIEQYLLKNYKVQNWDSSWRYPKSVNQSLQSIISDTPVQSRLYLYPKKSTDLFESAFKNLELIEGIDNAQYLFIKVISNAVKMQVLNAWQTEWATNEAIAKTVIYPATGFLAELCAINSGANKIIFYDVNKNNLEFKKKLYETWDGTDYEKFANDYAIENNLSIEPIFSQDHFKTSEPKQSTQQHIFASWDKFRETMDIEFVHCDILTNFDTLKPYFTENTLFGTSTILTFYPYSHILYSTQQIEIVRQRIAETVKQTKSVWVEMPYKLYDYT